MGRGTRVTTILGAACGVVVALSLLLNGTLVRAQKLTTKDVLNLPVPTADRRIPYGSHPLQFGDLRIPDGEGPFPVAIVVHGGCWLAQYNLDYISSFCAALEDEGIASWSLEYRRIGDTGGGWRGTFKDVAAGADHLRELAKSFPLDLTRVVAVGHSAGGHLVLWLAARHRLDAKSDFANNDPLPLSGVVSLAGVGDLKSASVNQVCGESVAQLLGGSPEEVPERYRQASPIELLPLGVPQRLVHGALDEIVPPELSRSYVEVAKGKEDDVELIICPGAGHFELIAPGTSAWQSVRDTIRSLVSPD